MALIPRCYVGDLELTDYPFSLAYNELDLGAGENMMTFFDALLQDGSIGTSDRTSNRTLVVPIYVEGSDLLELARNEETLILACEKARNTFTLEPGDDVAPPTVFDTFRIQARQVRDEAQEAAFIRRWDLTIPALPWARSADPVTVTFSPATPTITTLDDGSSLANWSIVPGYSVASLSTATWLGESAVKVDQTYSETVGSGVSLLRWSGAFGATPFVAVDIARDPVYSMPLTSFRAVAGGSNDNPVASQRLANGFTRFYFHTPASSPAELRLFNGSAADADFYIGGVYGASSIPSTGVVVADVPGSVRTQGVATVSGSGALGDTMVYADPTMLTNGWQPDEDTTWPMAPEGTYVIYRKDAASGTGGTFTATAGGQTVSTYLLAGAVPNNSWFPVGRVALGGNRSGRLGTSYSPLTETDTRIFRIAPDTSLTYVRGLSQSRLLIDLPSLDYPRGGVWAGAAGAETSVLDAADSWDYPTLAPPVTAFFIRAAGDVNAASTATFHPRSHTFNAWSP